MRKGNVSSQSWAFAEQARRGLIGMVLLLQPILAKAAAIAAAVAVFVVIERVFALRREQRVFRPGWRVDALHFVLSHLLTQVGLVFTIGLAFAALAPIVDSGAVGALQAAVAGQARWAQLGEAVLVTDVAAYWLHRAAHAVPWLWRFHRVHHSSERLDWLASARVHPVDVVIVRTAQFVPLFVLGFSQETFGAYAVFVSAWALVLHGNVRWRFGPLRFLFATPHFHHWHHTNDPVGRDRNFAGQLPLLDLLFGTLHLPARSWPATYGVDDDSKLDDGYLSHLRASRRQNGV